MAIDTLRPTSWDEYIGQEDLKRKLSIHIEAAKRSVRMPEHMLLMAGPGYGKTSLVDIIANELSEPLEVVTMPITTSALIAIVRSFEGILFLDEIHRASKSQLEDLLPLLEFGKVQTPGFRQVEAGNLTVIGATTEPHLVIAPLKDRFPIIPHFAEYSEAEMSQILRGMCAKMHIDICEETARPLAQAAMGTPRRCRQFALALRDLRDSGLSSSPSAEDVLDLCGVEHDGLSMDHMRYMETLASLGGAKGLRVIASLMRYNEAAILDLERTLMERGLVQIGSMRELTRLGYERLKTLQST